MKHLISIELKKALSIKFFIVSMVLIFGPLIVITPIINGSYSFFRPIEVHAQLISSSSISLLFPIFLVALYANSYANEKEENFLLYVKPRTNISKYVLAKGFVNATVTFIVAFLMIFIPFVFVQYIDPALSIIQYETTFYQPVSVGTFEFLAERSVLLYGLVYSLWVAVNGVLYVSVAYLLSICIKNRFVALSVPFLWWFIMNFVTGVLGIESFSPIFSVFPFLIATQPIWTAFIPFAIIILTIVSLCIYIKSKEIVWND
ncbi:ABC transporter permease [Heyndrickxia sporothermodurans]|uniref:ABC transporter permease n=1 Tax=Heyndrickxia sporothermodurans TaxID=46224 RepID=UPI0035DE47DC